MAKDDDIAYEAMNRNSTTKSDTLFESGQKSLSKEEEFQAWMANTLKEGGYANWEERTAVGQKFMDTPMTQDELMERSDRRYNEKMPTFKHPESIWRKDDLTSSQVGQIREERLKLINRDK